VDVTGTAHPPPPLAFVRYINAVSDTFNLDFRAVDQVSYSQPFLDVPFRGLGGGNYQGYQAGARHIRVFLDPNPSDPTVGVNPAIVSTFLVDTTYTFTAGTYYTILHIGGSRAGSVPAEKLWIITDALPAQSATGYQFRIINAAPVLGAVDVYTSNDTTATPPSGSPVAASVAFQAPPTAYLTQPIVPAITSYDTIPQPPPKPPKIVPNMGYTVFRITTPGTFTTVGSATGYRVQQGTPGTTAADPIYGSSVAGSVFTAFIFDASAAGTVSSAPAATPGVVYWPDLQPPRTTTDMRVPATRVANP